MLFLRHDQPVLLLEDPGALSKEEREFLRLVGAVPIDEEEERDLGVAARLELVIECKPQLHEPRRRDDFATGIGVDHAASPGIVDADPGPARSFTGKGDALSVEHDEVLTGETEPFQTRDAHLVERLDEEDEGYGVKLVAGIAQPERDLNKGQVHQSMRKRTPGHSEFGCRHDDAVDAVFEGSHRRPRVIRCGGTDLAPFHLRHVVDGGRHQRQDERATFIRPHALWMTGQAQLRQALASQIVPGRDTPGLSGKLYLQVAWQLLGLEQRRGAATLPAGTACRKDREYPFLGQSDWRAPDAAGPAPSSRGRAGG